MIVASFADKAALGRAAQALREARLGPVETYTPAKLSDEGPDSAVSPIPLAMFAGGLVGFGFMLWLQIFATVTAYPIDVGGRPNASWPAYITNAFEVGVLSAMLVGFVAFLALNRMPALYDPVDESRFIRQASRDDWFLALRPAEGDAPMRARRLLEQHDPQTLEELDA